MYKRQVQAQAGFAPAAIIPKEAVPIDPKQERHISMQSAKSAETAATSAQKKNGKKKKNKPRRSIFGTIMRFIGCLLCVCIMAASAGAVLLSLYVVQVTEDPDGKLDLDEQKLKQTSIVYDRDGNEVNTFAGENNRIWRDISAMPENLQNAVIAVEDKDFRSEPGINVKRTIAAALNEFTGNALLGSKQGASTLEQQLIKNLTDDNSASGIDGALRKVRECLEEVGTTGTAKQFFRDTTLFKIAGKTGTTSSNYDRYFVGYTPYYTAAVWIGYDQNASIRANGNPAAQLWKKVMSEAHENLPNQNFNGSTADMTQVTVCIRTGLLQGPGCTDVQTVWVAASNAPALVCDGHVAVNLCTESGKLATEYCPAECVQSVNAIDFTTENLTAA